MQGYGDHHLYCLLNVVVSMIKKEEKKQGKWISFHNHCELMLHMYQYRNLSFEITKVAEEEKVAAGRSEQSNHGW